MKAAGPLKEQEKIRIYNIALMILVVLLCFVLVLLTFSGGSTSATSRKGMIGNSSLLAAVLTVASVVSLNLLLLFCLRCKRKSKVIHEEHQIYNPQTFQREGSRFAVTRSKTVTRENQIPTTTIETRNESSPAAIDNQSSYGNIRDSHTGSLEHTYVDPLPMSLYENEEQNKKRISDPDESPSVYANLPSPDDEDDYENSDFLKQQEAIDEPDYVNENGEC